MICLSFFGHIFTIAIATHLGQNFLGYMNVIDIAMRAPETMDLSQVSGVITS